MIELKKIDYDDIEYPTYSTWWKKEYKDYICYMVFIRAENRVNGIFKVWKTKNLKSRFQTIKNYHKDAILIWYADNLNYNKEEETMENTILNSWYARRKDGEYISIDLTNQKAIDDTIWLLDYTYANSLIEMIIKITKNSLAITKNKYTI